MDDSALHLAETDTEAGSHWTPNNIDYSDHPKVTVEKLYEYGNYYVNGQLYTAGGSEDFKTVTEKSITEKAGTGASLHGKLTINTTTTALQDVNWIFPPYGSQVGNQHYQLTDTNTDTIEGDEQSPTSDSFTETKHHVRTESRYMYLHWTQPTSDGTGTIAFTQTNSGNTSWDETTTESLVNGEGTLTGATGIGTHHREYLESRIGPAGGYSEGARIDTGTPEQPRTEELVDGHAVDHAHTHTVLDRTGTDPETGQNVDWHWDNDDPSTWTNEGDWFKQISDFGAGMADTLTGGLTQKVRAGAGYDDVVNKNSTAYKAGVVAGTVLDVALTPVNPCGKAAWLAKGVKAISVAQAAGHGIAAGEAFANGDYAEGALSLVSARMSAAKLGKSCFTAGTPILTEGGSKPIEELRSYAEHGNACDHVLARGRAATCESRGRIAS